MRSASKRGDAPQRTHDLREVFDALCAVDREGRRPPPAGGCSAPRLPALGGRLYQQTQRWLAAGVFEAMAHDLRGLLCRLASGREPSGHEPEPTAAILESRTLRSTPESGARGGYDGAKKTQEGLQGPRGGGHPGPPAGATPHPGRRAGARAGGRGAGVLGAGGHGRVGGAGLGGPGLLRRPRLPRRPKLAASGWRWSGTPGPRRASRLVA
jgi:hypothetical protein